MPRRFRIRDERGSGPIGAWVGFSIFLGLLLVAVQILFNLYATSVVTSVSYDAARRVAASAATPGMTAEAEADARRALGRYAERVTFDWSQSDTDVVVLSVHARNPSIVLPSVAAPLTFAEINRTMRVRVERFR